LRFGHPTQVTVGLLHRNKAKVSFPRFEVQKFGYENWSELDLNCDVAAYDGQQLHISTRNRDLVALPHSAGRTFLSESDSIKAWQS
jgi:hypothetical protein